MSRDKEVGRYFVIIIPEIEMSEEEELLFLVHGIKEVIEVLEDELSLFNQGGEVNDFFFRIMDHLDQEILIMNYGGIIHLFFSSGSLAIP